MTNLIIKNFVKNYENYEDPEVRGAYGKLAGWVGIIMNLLLFALKFCILSPAKLVYLKEKYLCTNTEHIHVAL